MHFWLDTDAWPRLRAKTVFDYEPSAGLVGSGGRTSGAADGAMAATTFRGPAPPVDGAARVLCWGLIQTAIRGALAARAVPSLKRERRRPISSGLGVLQADAYVAADILHLACSG